MPGQHLRSTQRAAGSNSRQNVGVPLVRVDDVGVANPVPGRPTLRAARAASL